MRDAFLPNPLHFDEPSAYWVARVDALHYSDRPRGVRAGRAFIRQAFAEWREAHNTEGDTVPIKRTPTVRQQTANELGVEKQLEELARTLDLDGSRLRAEIRALVMLDRDLTPDEDAELARLSAEHRRRAREKKHSDEQGARRRAKYLKKHGEPVTDEERAAYLDWQINGTPKEQAAAAEQRAAAAAVAAADREAAVEARRAAAAADATASKDGFGRPAPAVEFTEPKPRQRSQPARAGLVGYMHL